MCKTLVLLHIFWRLRCSERHDQEFVSRIERAVSAMKWGGGWRCIVISSCLRIEKQKLVLLQLEGWWLIGRRTITTTRTRRDIMQRVVAFGRRACCLLTTISTSCSAVIRFIGFVQQFRNCISRSSVGSYRPIQQ